MPRKPMLLASQYTPFWEFKQKNSKQASPAYSILGYKKFLLGVSLFFLIQISAQAQELIPYRSGDLWGYCDRQKNLLIPCQFEDAQFFIGDLAKVKQNGQWGLMDLKGDIFLPCEFDLVYSDSKKGRVVVALGVDSTGQGGKWGYLPRYRGKLPEMQYDLIRECNIPYSLGVNQGGKWGMINRSGKVKIPIRYEVERVEDHQFENETLLESSLTTRFLPIPSSTYLKLNFEEGKARVRYQNKWGYINTFGNPIIPIEYEFIGTFKDDLACVVLKTAKGYKTGFINQENVFVIPPSYDFASPEYKFLQFEEGLVQVSRDGKWGYIDKRNKIVIPFRYGVAKAFNEGVAAVSFESSYLNPSWLFINRKGDELFRLKEGQELIDFFYKEGFIRIKEEGRQNWLDPHGKKLREEGYAEVGRFRNGSAYFIQKTDSGSFMGFINRQGEESIRPLYAPPARPGKIYQVENLFLVKKGNYWGLIDHKERVLLSFVYEDIVLPTTQNEEDLWPYNLIAVKKEGKWGYISPREKPVIPFRYEQVSPFRGGFARVKFQGRWGYIDTRGTEFFD